jgi:quinol monooxygenase YgiN
MYIVHVFVKVKEGYIEAFKEVTVENARHSVLEPGITRFDVIQQFDDPASFVLVEVYRSFEDPAKHKETEHYNRWREIVAPMMAEPRTSIRYSNIYPDELGW